jgi:hypothetical protein
VFIVIGRISFVESCEVLHIRAASSNKVGQLPPKKTPESMENLSSVIQHTAK